MTCALAAEGTKAWFLVGPDSVTRVPLLDRAAAVIESTGGRAIGSVRYPTDATTFAQR